MEVEELLPEKPKIYDIKSVNYLVYENSPNPIELPLFCIILQRKTSKHTVI